jgi:hypothetical protein
VEKDLILETLAKDLRKMSAAYAEAGYEIGVALVKVDNQLNALRNSGLDTESLHDWLAAQSIFIPGYRQLMKSARVAEQAGFTAAEARRAGTGTLNLLAALTSRWEEPDVQAIVKSVQRGASYNDTQDRVASITNRSVKKTLQIGGFSKNQLLAIRAALESINVNHAKALMKLIEFAPAAQKALAAKA